MPSMASSAPSLANAAAHAFVIQHLGDTIAPFPDTVRDALIEKFIADYNDPLTPQLESVVRKRLTDDEVRHMLFAPTPLQQQLYADVLSLRDDREDPTSWQCLVRKRFLTLFYLKHARNWALVVEFLLCDGLQILTNLFLHRDLQLRGQAIDVFVQITSNPLAFEWFDEPVGYGARLLHAKMIALASPKAQFLPRIVANIHLYEEPQEKEEEAVRLPGGTLVLLQVLAFFLSWVRKFYTQNELRLSQALLDLLRDWKQRTRSKNEEELQLAKQVYDDFSRWPAIEGAEHDRLQYIDVLEKTSSSSSNIFSPAKVDELLQLADREDDAVERAIALCSEAVDANVHVVDALVCRARARLRQIQDSPKTAAVADTELCLQDCRKVLERAPGTMAAWRCQLGLLETMERWDDGRDMLDACKVEDFVPDDAAFLSERRSFFDEKLHETQQRQAEASRHNATRDAKQQQVVQLLLQRTSPPSVTTPVPASSVSFSGDGKTSTKLEEVAQRAVATASSSRDVLARFRSSSTSSSKKKTPSKKKPLSFASVVISDSPLGGIVTARGFVRKLTQCKHDVVAIRSLLLSTSIHDVITAIETALPEPSLVIVLEALVVQPKEDHEQVPHVMETSCMRLLQHLLSLPRFAFMREMASPTQQRQIDDLVHRATDMLGLDTALAA